LPLSPSQLNAAVFNGQVTHDLSIGFSVGRLKAARWLGFMFSQIVAIEKNRLFQPVKG